MFDLPYFNDMILWVFDNCFDLICIGFLIGIGATFFCCILTL